jgi:hypothetical protein
MARDAAFQQHCSEGNPGAGRAGGLKPAPGAFTRDRFSTIAGIEPLPELNLHRVELAARHAFERAQIVA